MGIRQHVRPLAAASLLALSFLSLGSGLVHAEDSASCQSRGYEYDPSTGRCADNYCTHDGQTYRPGDQIQVYIPPGNTITNGHWQFYMCDGFTGQWFLVGRTSTTNQAPVPLGAAEPGGQTHTTSTTSTTLSPTSPVTPHPIQTAH